MRTGIEIRPVCAAVRAVASRPFARVPDAKRTARCLAPDWSRRGPSGGAYLPDGDDPAVRVLRRDPQPVAGSRRSVDGPREVAAGRRGEIAADAPPARAHLPQQAVGARAARPHLAPQHGAAADAGL